MEPTVTRLIVLTAVIMTATAPVASVAAAQAGGSDSTGQLLEANISVTVGDTVRVDAVYQFKRQNPDGHGTAWLNGTMWRFDGELVRRLEIFVDGTVSSSTVRTEERHTVIAIPVNGTAGTTTVRMRYTLPATEHLVVPLWVPELPAGGAGDVVSIRVTLPPEKRLITSRFPTVDEESANGRVVTYQTTQPPGFLALTYASEPSGVRRKGLLGSGVAIAVLGLWALVFRLDRRGGR